MIWYNLRNTKAIFSRRYNCVHQPAFILYMLLRYPAVLFDIKSFYVIWLITFYTVESLNYRHFNKRFSQYLNFGNKMIISFQKIYFWKPIPYPEPVYTGWSSVHWNATGMPLVDPVYTGIPLEKLSWNSPTLECHWRNLVESAPHWDATGETLTFAAYTGTPLEGLWQPNTPRHI